MTDKVRTVRLYGTLGARFGRVHRFVCADTAGAIRALCHMVPGFQPFLYESKDRGLGYACFIGKENIGESALTAPAGDEDIRIAPVIIGSGRGGFFQIILGAALIGAAFFTGGTSLAAWGTLQYAMAGLGAGLLFGGVASMLTRQPAGLQSVQSTDNGQSYTFNGPENLTAQGNPVPILYGEAIVGSIVVSADMYSEDQQ
ncbi:tail assembly protein [Orrella sp. 11846]|uniref:tail assembly protein n=1 Tax=Orrella sp. 11846 TaxID=3409913 RepID=UPI003B5A6240